MRKSRKKPTGDQSPERIETSFFRSSERTFAGYAVDLEDLTRSFTIDLLVDGLAVKTAIANECVQKLVVRGVGNGCYGFTFSLGKDAVENAYVIEARLSNLGRGIGQPIILHEPYREGIVNEGPSFVRWLGGLRFSGWINNKTETAPTFDALVDGQLVSRAKALGWSHIAGNDDNGRAVRSFDFHLPERFADGNVHRLTVVDENGATLGNTILPFVAFSDGLAKTISDLGEFDSQRLRGELFDVLLPMSLPMSFYDNWRERFPIAVPEPTGQKGAVILVGAETVEGSLASLDQQTHNDWIAASLVVAGEPTGLDSIGAQAFLADEGRDCGFVIFARAGTLFEPSALARVANALERLDDAVIIYGDMDTIAADGRRWPLAFSAFDYERMLEQGYCAHMFAVRRVTAQQALARAPSSLYRLFNSFFDEGVPESGHVVHLPGALACMASINISTESAALISATSAHLSARGISAKIINGKGNILPAVRVMRSMSPGRTTVIIPTRNRLSLLRRCIESILPAVEKASAKILVVDNDSTDPETLAYLETINSQNNDIDVVRIEGPFNFARLNNLAVAALTSEYLCLLNNDVEATNDEWLEEMLGRISEPDVGAVGALLLWPSGVVQHGGVVLGPNFGAQHSFNDRVDGDPGFGDLLRVAHECSAVTAACMLTRRSDYLSVGGMDEARFSVAFNDVD